MRSFRHSTPRYIKNRLAVMYYEKVKSDHPWLTQSANTFLDSYLTKYDVGLEYGSGRSTIWFARRIGHLTSVEHNVNWATKVEKMLNQENIDNVNYKILSADVEEEKGNETEYVRVADSFDADSLDFCLVDGKYRGFCTLRVIDKIRPGGLLVIDNVNWYLPSNSYSPSSRHLNDGPQDPIWEEIERLLSHWRKFWTTSGVTDTALFFKPCTAAAEQVP